MREIAVIYTDNKNDISSGILGKLDSEQQITVFCYEGMDFNCGPNTKTVIIPGEMRNKESVIRNFISKHYIDNGFKGFLHVISDSVEILKDTSEFSDKIEEMMCKLNLKSWFNTITDPCNYNFKLYNPRVFVEIDKDDAKKVYDKKVYWTSHANTSYIIYDFSKATFDDVRFEEQFTIPMFFIIEFLARRRNSKKSGELNYMNFYPTIDEERGVFRLREGNNGFKNKTQQEMDVEKNTMDRENEIFRNMRVDNSADTSIEMIIEDMYNILVGNP